MTHDVFISYSSKDKPVTDGICANLEAAGIRCWIAPRDIAPGEDWPTAIADAIPRCKIMVLVFSANSNASKDVSNEISLAFNNNLILIPFKIEDVRPEPGKDYYLARTHWLDAINPPTQGQINALVDRVKSLIPVKASPPVPGAEPGSYAHMDQTIPGNAPPLSHLPGPTPGRSPAWSRYLWIPAAFVLLVLSGWVILTYFSPSFAARIPSQPPPTETAAVAIAPPAALTPTPTITPSTPEPSITPGESFLDNLDSQNTKLFIKSDGMADGNPDNAGWRADHINFSNGIMTITLDNLTCPSGCSGHPYASGNYHTSILHGFGLYEGRLKSAKASGIVGGSFFINTGPWDNQPWDEIDMRLLGKDPTWMQTNYYADGVFGHQALINLGFDSSVGFHTYGIEYRENYINWYVDGKLVHSEDGSLGVLPSHKMKLALNLWPGIGVDDWLGPFSYTGPLNMQVDWVKYTP